MCWQHTYLTTDKNLVICSGKPCSWINISVSYLGKKLKNDRLQMMAISLGQARQRNKLCFSNNAGLISHFYIIKIKMIKFLVQNFNHISYFIDFVYFRDYKFMFFLNLIIILIFNFVNTQYS